MKALSTSAAFATLPRLCVSRSDETDPRCHWPAPYHGGGFFTTTMCVNVLSPRWSTPREISNSAGPREPMTLPYVADATTTTR